MKKIKDEIKVYPARLPKELWKFLKQLSLESEMSMNEIVIGLILNHKKNLEKQLTKFDITI